MKFVLKAKELVLQSPSFIAGVFLIFVTIGLYGLNLTNQMITGEALYDFSYPYRLSLFTSWKVFFFDRIRSRLMHGVFISTLYHLFGFNPPAIYVTIYIVVILTAVIITLVLSDFIKRPWLVALLTLTFTLLPLNLPDMFLLKKAHHVFAWFFFWLAVLLLKKWFVTSKRILLIFGTLAFMASVFSYEAAIALLPVTILISIPNLRDFKDFLRKTGLIFFITLCTALAFLRLEDLKSSGIGQVYHNYSNVGVATGKAFVAVPQILEAIWRGGLFDPYISPTPAMFIFTRFALVICLLLAVFAAAVAIRRTARGKKSLFTRFQDDSVALLLAGLYLTFATYLPFMLAGQPPDGDSLRGAAFGLLFVALAAAAGLRQQGWRRAAQAFVSSMCVLSLGLGVFNYSVALPQAMDLDHKLSNFVYTLKQQIPYVKENTTFIFVEVSFSRTGDMGLLNMLYGRSNIKTIHLFDYDEEETYVREPDLLVEDGGREYQPDFIIITFDESGRVRLIDSISYEQYPNLPITWVDSTPIFTNRDRILETVQGSKPTTPLYVYVVQFRAKMGW